MWALEMEFLAQRLPMVKWILPQAHFRRVTLSQGQVRPAWFDIASLPPHPNDFDGAGIAGSIHAAEQIILEEVQRGVHPRKIFLVGFSQGAALSLMTGLTTLHDLGGIGSLSGWIPHRIRDHILENSSNLPIFWGLGYSDTEIPFRYALNSVEFLEEQVRIPHSSMTIKEYRDLGHETSDEELIDLADWLEDAMKIAYDSTDSGSS
ncbi:alpha/beta-hydrolase [Schizopora paradoxa]|uniref:Acyl-protein thioesterase 1 n=1 Tax=Schizopora paradoxa TaxID=27342 RepID=A0A0H2SSG3_9AGAM|nr:alpha/beta-hydrolase [Schizopora paradoxa]